MGANVHICGNQVNYVPLLVQDNILCVVFDVVPVDNDVPTLSAIASVEDTVKHAGVALREANCAVGQELNRVGFLETQ